MSNKSIGDKGERLAEAFLKKRGWRILSRNFKAHGGEIDIIGYRFGVLAFFEVKTRSGLAFGRPAEAVDEKKLYHIQTAIKAFLGLYCNRNSIKVFYPLGIELKRPINKQRIDVIEVLLGEEPKINHIKNWGSRYEIY